jgi:hypothetical protein
VLRELLRVYPDAHVFTLIDKMGADDRRFLGVRRVSTSALDAIPSVGRRYRSMLPLFPAAMRSLDVSAFDVVISNSHAIAKNVRTHERQLHVCYCLSPMRYAWDLREQYLVESGLDSGMRGIVARAMLERLKRWDRARSADVDTFVTLSHYIEDRIQRAYGRSSAVIACRRRVFTRAPAIRQWATTRPSADSCHFKAPRPDCPRVRVPSRPAPRHCW